MNERWRLGLAGGLLAAGGYLLSRARQARGIEIARVVFNSPGFTPGSSHTASITLRNSGGAPLTVASVRLVMESNSRRWVDDTWYPNIAMSAGQVLATPLTRSFAIPADLVPGAQVRYSLWVTSNSRTASALGLVFA